jgi:hypothetical protein
MLMSDIQILLAVGFFKTSAAVAISDQTVTIRPRIALMHAEAAWRISFDHGTKSWIIMKT